MQRVSFEEMKFTIKKAFTLAGMSDEKADLCATTHTQSSCDGISSHGLNRVEKFIQFVHKGWVDVNADPTLDKSLGLMEIYNGNLGPGISNARFAMGRAIELARQHGFAIVSMHNTTHWMRGGAYGWQAAENECIGICWTNTESCMPAWGSRSGNIGNNPFIMAVPRKEGHVVLDMAMSQYSYGKLQVTRLKEQKLPFPGGFDLHGKLTDDPEAIEQTRRLLPMGYWKGSGFAIMLDLISSLLSGGLTTAGIDKKGKGSCGSCCQVFITIDPKKINTEEFINKAIGDTIAQVKSGEAAEPGKEIFYPGEQSLKSRAENLHLGIPVDEQIWESVKSLANV